MIIRYEPQGGVSRRWDLGEVRLLTSEAEAVERVTGQDWADVISVSSLALKARPAALRAIVWVLLKREQPTLRHRDFDPGINEVTARITRGEYEELLAEVDRLADSEAEHDAAVRDLLKRLDEDEDEPGADGPKEHQEHLAVEASPNAA